MNDDDEILDAFASLGHEPEPDDKSDPDPNPDEGEGDTSEGSNESPTDQGRVYTEAELEAAINSRLSGAVTEVQRRQNAAAIQKLLNEGSDEDVAKFVRQQYQQTATRTQIEAEVTDEYAEGILSSILTEDFLSQLNDKDQADIDPDRFNTDAEFYAALIEKKAELVVRARDAEAAKKAAAETEKAKANNEKGKKLNSGSPSNLPASGSEPSEPTDNGSLWAAAWEEIASSR